MLPDFSPASTDRDSLDSTFSDDLQWDAEKHDECKVINGRCLRDYRNVVIDMCSLAVTVLWTGSGRAPPTLIDDFKALLRAERIHHRRLDPSWGPLAKNSVRIRDAEDMRRLICKLPTGLRLVTPHS